MEPELFSLARRMCEAWWIARRSFHGFSDEVVRKGFWRDTVDLDKQGWLAAAITARPDLAEDVRVAADHWAVGVLGIHEEASAVDTGGKPTS